jgi:alpha-L-arabinofuranosidase
MAIKTVNAKIWDLGNEVDGVPGKLGHKTADDYVKNCPRSSQGNEIGG